MAHANPEFAIGLMRRDHAPVSHQIREPVTFRDLAARMAAIQQLVDDDVPLRLHEAAAYRAWRKGLRRIGEKSQQEAREHTSLAEPKAGGMHAGGKIGERFVEPRMRLPLDVQAGRTKARRAPSF